MEMQGTARQINTATSRITRSRHRAFCIVRGLSRQLKDGGMAERKKERDRECACVHDPAPSPAPTLCHTPVRGCCLDVP